jgi:hypothetical protein
VVAEPARHRRDVRRVQDRRARAHGGRVYIEGSACVRACNNPPLSDARCAIPYTVAHCVDPTIFWPNISDLWWFVCPKPKKLKMSSVLEVCPDILTRHFDPTFWPISSLDIFWPDNFIPISSHRYFHLSILTYFDPIFSHRYFDPIFSHRYFDPRSSVGPLTSIHGGQRHLAVWTQRPAQPWCANTRRDVRVMFPVEGNVDAKPCPSSLCPLTNAHTSHFCAFLRFCTWWPCTLNLKPCTLNPNPKS